MRKNHAKKEVENLRKTYDTISSEFSDTRGKFWWDEFALFNKEIKDRQFIIDLGCGNGRFLDFLNKKGMEYLGIDNSKKLINIARKKYKKAKFLVADLTKLPVENNSVDIALSVASFHHLPSIGLRNKALEEVNRILKKDGKLLITVWNLWQKKYKKYIWKARLQSILTFGKYGLRDTLIPWGTSKEMRYYHAFTPKELKSLLKSHGFQITKEQVNRNITFICKKLKS